VLGIDQNDLSSFFQNVENWMPKHTRTLHGDHGHTELIQPIIEPQQVTGHGCKGTGLFLHMPIRLRDQDGGHGRLLMHIDGSTALVDHLHNEPPQNELGFSAMDDGRWVRKNGQDSSACS